MVWRHPAVVRVDQGDTEELEERPTLVPESRRPLAGVVDVAVPITPNADVYFRTNPDRPDVVDVPVSIVFQACSDTICYTPRTEELSLELPFESLLRRGQPRAR